MGRFVAADDNDFLLDGSYTYLERKIVHKY